MFRLSVLVMAGILAAAGAAAGEPESLISRIISRPEVAVEGQWVIGTRPFKVDGSTVIRTAGDAELARNACVKVDYIRDQSGALWAQQITLLPLRTDEQCDKAAAETLK